VSHGAWRWGAVLAVAAMQGLAPVADAQAWQKTESMGGSELQVASRPGPVFKAEFLNPAMAPSEWTLVLYRDGTGHFHADRGNSTAPKPETIEPVTVDRAVRLSPEFTAEVFQTVRKNNYLNVACASHLKVAFQGWKTLSYQGPDGAGSCRFNYSKNKEIEALGESLVGVASTLMEGARLELLREHEPLGLDREMGYLVDAAGDGRLQQIYAIRGILRELEADPAVMERVRKQARKLLAESEHSR
jgi:hypothetical protein